MVQGMAAGWISSSFGNEASDEICLLRVKYDSEKKCSSVCALKREELNSIDQDLGLISFVTPYVTQAVEEKKKLEERIAILSHHEKPVLFVEGISDEKILKKAFDVLAPKLAEAIVIKSDAEKGGVSFVRDMLIAAAHSRRQLMACGLFDNDAAGRKARQEFMDHPRSNEAPMAKSLLVQRPDHFDWNSEAKLDLVWDIEETLSFECWIHAESSNWLSQRAAQILVPLVMQQDSQLAAHLTDTHKSIYLKYEISDEKKLNFANYVCGLQGEHAKAAFKGMGRTIKKIAEIFKIEIPEEQKVEKVTG